MADRDQMDRRSSYYRTVAKYFFEQRGAPFFLSSKEFSRICQWEEMNIPLRVVLEGLKGSFERCRGRAGRRRKPHTLDYCHPFVLEAFQQYIERRVGSKENDSHGGKKDREKKILVEVERFLNEIPDQLCVLKPVYSRLKKKLAAGTITEEDLEKAEDTIERLMTENLSPEQTKAITAEIVEEFGIRRNREFDQIFGIKAIKTVREKYKIPHVSPFYY
jgi:hypothetical protein